MLKMTMSSRMYVIFVQLVFTYGLLVSGDAVDYTCLHSYSWSVNTNSHYNTKYATSTAITTSAYYSTAKFRALSDVELESNVAPFAGPPATVNPTVGWGITYTGIPNYDHTFTAEEVSTLNARPKASTDFKTGKTTAAVGQLITFGKDIGYSSTSCTDGYWPVGPGCPAKYSGSTKFNLQPAPEIASGDDRPFCLHLS